MLYMEEARNAFAAAQGVIQQNNTESRFYHRLAEMIPNRVDVDTLILAVKIALLDEERAGRDSLEFISLIPQYVRQCASFEFCHEFRRKFNSLVLGLTQDELPDVDYGYSEVSKDVINISSKDRYEVLAALYNASTPVGKGFIEYNPIAWDREKALFYYEEFGIVEEYGRLVKFNWILGRPVHVTFQGDLVYVSRYNQNSEEGFAQRVISTVPNKVNVRNNRRK